MQEEKEGVPAEREAALRAELAVSVSQAPGCNRKGGVTKEAEWTQMGIKKQKYLAMGNNQKD